MCCTNRRLPSPKSGKTSASSVKNPQNPSIGALPSQRFGCGVRSGSVRARRTHGVRAMVSTLAATILVALGLAGSAPVGLATQPSSPTVFVAGHGWGHGIGLAQYGAYGYALHGWRYDK